MRDRNDIDWNYIETFKFRINALLRGYEKEQLIKDLLSEIDKIAAKYRGQWFEMYVRWFQVLNRYRRRYFYGDLQWKTENFLVFELMGQKEAHWKLNQKNSSTEIDVITLSIAQMNDVFTQRQAARESFIAAPVVKSKNTASDVLVTAGIAFGMGVLFAAITTAVVITLPISLPLMIGVIVGASVLGFVVGAVAKKVVDFCSRPRKEKPVVPSVDGRPRGINEVYKVLLDLDRKPSVSTPGSLKAIPKSNKKENNLQRSESKLDTSPVNRRVPGFR